MIDYHVHTSLCNHAEGEMEAYVQKAVAVGLKEICFLDHLTLAEAGRALSMTPEEVPLYFQAVCDLKQRYQSLIHVKAGLEIDFDLEYIDRIQDIVGRYSFDVIGSSVHFVNDFNIVSRKSAWKLEKVSTDFLYEQYLKHLERMLDFSYFDFLCHLDLVKKFGRQPPRSFDKKFDEILSKIRYKNLAVELNTSGYDHPVKEAYPSLRLLKKCSSLGIPITLGSDAHKPESVGRYYDRAFSMLCSAGCRYLAVFTKRKRHAVPIEIENH